MMNQAVPGLFNKLFKKTILILIKYIKTTFYHFINFFNHEKNEKEQSQTKRPKNRVYSLFAPLKTVSMKYELKV